MNAPINRASKALFLGLLLTSASSLALAGTFEKTKTGIVVTPDKGDAKEVRLEVISGKIVHVTATPKADQDLMPSLMRVAPVTEQAFEVTSDAKKVTLKTASVTAEVALDTGVVTFKKANGQTTLKEEGRGAIKPVTIEGPSITPTDTYVSVQQQFNKNTTEHFYGLGQQQNAVVDFNGEDALLMQHNMHIAVPFVISDRGYGVLWDNNSITRWGDPKPYGPLGRDLKITDLDGKAGALTAKYYVGDALKLTRSEADIDYQYIPDIEANWPAELKAEKNQKVVWEGTFTADQEGLHKFQLYSSGYATLYIDDKPVLKDIWRQNWNAWYHNFNFELKKGKSYKFRLEWVPEGGYITVLHNNPMPKADRHSMLWTSEVGEAIDYYYIDGDNADQIISGYRQITGKSSMMPKWSYGFWQSRQRYKTAQEIIDTVKEYRARKIPLDNIVLDWFYWPEDSWGSHDFDKSRFPDPKGLVDAVHKEHAQIMISVWGKFYPTTDNYKELDSKGYIYRRNVDLKVKDWVGPGYDNTHYDPYAKEARDIYWRQIKEKLNVYGFDAWWADNTEPDIHSNMPPEELKLRIGPTHAGPGAAVFNPYSLMTTTAFYEGERATDADVRPFILTRSGFAGLQRNASAVWSGDVVARWNNLYNQIGAGISISLSGIPNWTHDIGGFSTEQRYNATPMKPEDQAEWQELQLRWFQFGAFSPLFRSHGEFPLREVYNLAEDNTDVQDSLIWYTKLRYRLMPYIYSEAAATHHQDGTIMRGFLMDFAQDEKAKTINDSYMFGHNILVAPVYDYKARSRKVYLPKGADWYDFYSGQRHKGGQSISASAPLTRIPLFVKSGAIIPMGPVTQYVDEKPDAPLTIAVYQGADGAFRLYEDDGVSHGFERGEFSTIDLAYDDKTGTLNIGARHGQFKGMVETRTFRVRFLKAGEATASEFDRADQIVTYNGTALTVKRP